MPFEIIRGDITEITADAIVNTANPNPVIGSGVDAGIHKKAGSKLLETRKKIGPIPAGQASVTPAFDLDAKFVIHAVGPVWKDGAHGEETMLRRCYDSALALAAKKRCKSVVFPLLSTGNYGFPKAVALQIAVNAFSAFLMDHEMRIILVVFDRDAFALSEKLFQSVQSYIDEHYIQQKLQEEYAVADSSDIYRAIRERRQRRRIETQVFQSETFEEETDRKTTMSWKSTRLCSPLTNRLSALDGVSARAQRSGSRGERTNKGANAVFGGSRKRS